MFRILHRLAGPLLLLRDLLAAAFFLPCGEGEEETRQNARERAFAPRRAKMPANALQGVCQPPAKPGKSPF